MTSHDRARAARRTPPAGPVYRPVSADAAPERAEPLGTRFERVYVKAPSRRWRRRVRRWFRDGLVSLAVHTVPYLYYAYCAFVFRTSRVDDTLIDPVDRWYRDRGGGRLCVALWHQEVFTVAYGYRRVRPHTLASVGDAGRVITRMLELCGFRVFRGGSSKGQARRRRVLPLMIEYMQRAREPVLYGITVDGSKGPPYVLKPGVAVIAQRCRCAVWLARTWYSRRIELPTWDRTAIPLPFGRIALRGVGPYWIDPDAGPEELEAFRAHLERELQELCYWSRRLLDRTGHVPPGFPPGWRPRWRADRWGIARTPWDLDPDNVPPWAHGATRKNSGEETAA
ncbi:MAG: DUF374 domain-containing protein [Planctomycetota bacterium]|nr:MAG: DUF374 domain-containing protein [Planctomycetota bacterium]